MTRLILEILDNLQTIFSFCIFIWLVMIVFDFTWGLIKKWTVRIYKALMSAFEKKIEKKEDKYTLEIKDGVACIKE